MLVCLRRDAIQQPHEVKTLRVVLLVVIASGIGLAAGFILARRAAVSKWDQFEEAILPNQTPTAQATPDLSAGPWKDYPPEKTPADFQPEREKTAAEIARAVFPAVVLLMMQDAHGQPLSLGSGFFVEKNVIATNFHVIEGAASGYAKIIGQASKLAVEGIVGLDAAHDLTLLQLASSSAPALSIAPGASVSVGDAVFAVGNPRGLEGTFSEGIVSSVREFGSDRLLQVTAPISPGSSGGPVVDRTGSVIGVSVASITNGQNLNFAIPGDYVKALQSKKTELRQFKAVPQAKVSKTLLGQLAHEPPRAGVVGENLSYDTSSQLGNFSFSLHNTLSEDIANIYGILIFYDTRGQPIDVYPIDHKEVVPARLAKRIEGQVAGSVERLNCPVAPTDYQTLLRPRAPKGKVEFRILDFTVISD